MMFKKDSGFKLNLMKYFQISDTRLRHACPTTSLVTYQWRGDSSFNFSNLYPEIEKKKVSAKTETLFRNF
jgi:hypothetical protein